MAPYTTSSYKPSYFSMIRRAIIQINKANLKNDGETLKDRKQLKQISIHAIANFIRNHYEVNESVFKTYLKKAINKAISENKLTQTGRSLRLAASELPASLQVSKKVTRSSTRKAQTTAPKPVPAETVKEATAKRVKSTQVAQKKARAQEIVRKRITPTPIVSSNENSAPLTKPVGLKNDHMWQYFHNGWKNYDAKASDTVEEVYKGYLANRGDTDVRAVKSGEWEYMVDFMAMKQTNIQHPNHTVRNIRRVPLIFYENCQMRER